MGVGVARPVVGSTGETWLRWRFPSPVASSRRPGSSTGIPRFSRFWTRFFFRPLLVALVDCCLASLRAGVCSPPWRWRISVQVLMVTCLPLLQGRRSALSPIYPGSQGGQPAPGCCKRLVMFIHSNNTPGSLLGWTTLQIFCWLSGILTIVTLPLNQFLAQSKNMKYSHNFNPSLVLSCS